MKEIAKIFAETISDLRFIILMIMITFTGFIVTLKSDNTIDTIDEIKSQAAIVLKTNSDLQNAVIEFKLKLKEYELKTEILQAEKDSLLYQIQRSTAKDWNELQEIKRKQSELNIKLIILKEKNNAFN